MVSVKIRLFGKIYKIALIFALGQINIVAFNKALPPWRGDFFLKEQSIFQRDILQFEKLKI